MQTGKRWRCLQPFGWVLALLLGFVPAMQASAEAQEMDPASPEHAKHHASQGPEEPTMSQQIQELRAKILRLEAALQQGHRGKTAPETATGAAPASGGASTGSPGMKRMRGGPRDGMGGMAMGASMMGRMKTPPGMATPSALPGFPGASHLYHIGATGFFLDHTEHITLTRDQRAALNRIREGILLKDARLERRIDDAEQELWVLTGADAPDAGKLETKVREIEALRGTRRVDFIRAVGRAAKVLTDEQRRVLSGTMDHE